MPSRNRPSPWRRLIIAAFSTTWLLLAGSAHAENAERSKFLSMLMPSLADRPEDGGLAVQELRAIPQLPGAIDLTTPPENLWVRIRNGFAMTNLNDDLVLYYQQYYQNRPEALRRMVERSRPYLHYIVEELEARGMPTELALLPMVESSFNPMAYSRSHASGLWQFIPATGKRFKLEQNWWKDERRDVIASTNAALDYLQSIYEMHGDWHLALASYNWGEGAVKRAIEKNESRGLPTDYPNLTMPNETRHYVPKLQALKNIFANPLLVQRLGLQDIPNEAYFATLASPRTMDISTAARLANMSVDEFQRLNPSHNRPIIRRESSLVLPTDKLETFRANLNNQQTSLTHWQAYTVTSTERLDQIAARFSTTASELARANGLSERVRLAAGSTLLVPGSDQSGLSNVLNIGTPQQIIAPEVVERPCVKKASGKHSQAKCVATAAAPATHAAPAEPKGKTKGKATETGKASKASDKKAAKSQPANTSRAPAAAKKPAAKAESAGKRKRS